MADSNTASVADNGHSNGDATGINIGTMDILILASLAGMAVYYLFFRKNKKDEFDSQSIKSFTMDSSLVRSSSIAESGFVAKMKSSGRNLVLFYGSQTGTAEEFASRLAKEANRYGMKALVADPEECSMDDLTGLVGVEKSVAIFVLATYGEGDPTDNAQELMEWLKAGESDLTGIKYAVFGLGNKTYEHYNKVGIFADEAIAKMGATRVCELGLGDDDGNLEEDFITWKEKFWNQMREVFKIDDLGEDVTIRQYELKIHEPDSIPTEKIYKGEPARIGSLVNQKAPFDQKNPYLAPVVVNRNLYKGDRACLHIELSISESKMRYDPGDHVAVYAPNNSELVNKIGNLLNVDLDTVFSLKNLDEDSSKKFPFPCPTTYRTALTNYVDITSIPRTHILKEIAEYAKDESEGNLLKLMGSSSSEGKEKYHEWVVRSCRSIVHILEDCPSVRPPLDHLLELLPRHQPRYYSISSSMKKDPKTVHITAVVVNYSTPTGRSVDGVATSYLHRMQPSVNGHPTIVPIFIRRSTFRLPTKSATPVIMIGPGTGLAPFRGFLQERSWMKSEGQTVGDTILYFGCRKKSEDYLYQEELEQYVGDGVITKLYTAFSRDQAQKIYVTTLMKQNMEELWRVIGENNGHIYVCGDARSMAKDVHNIIEDTIVQVGGKTKEEAIDYIKKMELQRRYSADVWS